MAWILDRAVPNTVVFFFFFPLPHLRYRSKGMALWYQISLHWAVGGTRRCMVTGGPGGLTCACKNSNAQENSDPKMP